MKTSFSFRDRIVSPPQSKMASSLAEARQQETQQDRFKELGSVLEDINEAVAELVGMDGQDVAVRNSDRPSQLRLDSERPQEPRGLRGLLPGAKDKYELALSKHQAAVESAEQQLQDDKQAWDLGPGGRDRAQDPGLVVTLHGDNRKSLQGEIEFNPERFLIADPKRSLPKGLERLELSSEKGSYVMNYSRDGDTEEYQVLRGARSYTILANETSQTLTFGISKREAVDVPPEEVPRKFTFPMVDDQILNPEARITSLQDVREQPIRDAAFQTLDKEMERTQATFRDYAALDETEFDYGRGPGGGGLVVGLGSPGNPEGEMRYASESFSGEDLALEGLESAELDLWTPLQTGNHLSSLDYGKNGSVGTIRVERKDLVPRKVKGDDPSCRPSIRDTFQLEETLQTLNIEVDSSQHTISVEQRNGMSKLVGNQWIERPERGGG